MKNFCAVLMRVCLVLCPAILWSAPERPRLWVISATSQGPSSAAPSCVIAEICAGFWTPGMRDYGSGEGLYLQFEKPARLGAVEVVTNAPLVVSLNGRPLDTEGTAVGPAAEGRKNRYFVLGSTTAQEHTEEVKSLFIRIGAPDKKNFHASEGARIYALRFYPPFSAQTTLPLPPERRLYPVAPQEMAARVSASSVLEPQAAYQPAHLFDSRTDFAWSTNGKKLGNATAYVDVQWDAPLDIGGIVIWNGYQRSETHYKANGRPAALRVTGSRLGQAQDITLKDVMAPQLIHFAQPLMGTASLRLTLGPIYKGAAYPDVLLSEVRFITTQGDIVLPKVPLMAPPAGARLKPWLDRSFTSSLCVDSQDGTMRYSFKLRSNGGFTAYLNETAEGDKKETVWEGNWEEQSDGLRLFGKRYASFSGWQQVAYGLAAVRTETEIFQTTLKLTDFKSLSPAEQERIVRLALKAHHLNPLETESALPALTKALMTEDGVVLESALFTDVLTPTDTSVCHP